MRRRRLKLKKDLMQFAIKYRIRSPVRNNIQEIVAGAKEIETFRPEREKIVVIDFSTLEELFSKFNKHEFEAIAAIRKERLLSAKH